jgi:hypothetical protein
MNRIRNFLNRHAARFVVWFLSRNGLVAVRKTDLVRASIDSQNWLHTMGSKGTRSGETRRAGLTSARTMLDLTSVDVEREVTRG